jgi:hypothetical protein
MLVGEILGMTLPNFDLTRFRLGSERWRLLRATIKTIQPLCEVSIGKVEATVQTPPCKPVESHTLRRLLDPVTVASH